MGGFTEWTSRASWQHSSASWKGSVTLYGPDNPPLFLSGPDPFEVGPLALVVYPVMQDLESVNPME